MDRDLELLIQEIKGNRDFIDRAFSLEEARCWKTILALEDNRQALLFLLESAVGNETEDITKAIQTTEQDIVLIVNKLSTEHNRKSLQEVVSELKSGL